MQNRVWITFACISLVDWRINYWIIYIFVILHIYYTIFDKKIQVFYLILYLLNHKRFENIKLLYIVEFFQTNAALESLRDFAHIVFEASER